MSLYDTALKVSGTGTANDSSADATIIAAQGADERIYLQKAVLSVTVAAVGGAGLVALEDGVGGTVLFQADADAVGVYPIDFGIPGYPLTVNTLLNLTVNGAVTTEATARVTATGIAL